ncbi:hypothetical protein FCM35_KLT19142 [Carex littledalei]|uniref:Rx N-terminal domain-containing protein n=1 Tax=Carex littledalei TaxID=544730 RepID=A0A833RC38_9POAL|nr:hypothetical protein FCM35_KLT19142 [Carex littledalei]
MNGKPVLATLVWLGAPLIKWVNDKVYDHLGNYIFNKACDHLDPGTSIVKRRKLLEAEIPAMLPHLSVAVDKAEKSPKKEKLVDWLERLKVAYYEAKEAIDLLDYEQLEQKVMDDRKALELTEKNERRIQIRLPPQFVSRPLNSKYGVKLKSCIDKLIKLEEEADEFRDLLESNENDRDTDSSNRIVSILKQYTHRESIRYGESERGEEIAIGCL